ncbi:hypothetical protein D623_10017262 [Myotis brandtii]|uniref:Uncharacterized protein n=1 Tax=Myotis brandtii TaxID=109478 RepID=S7PHN3_MYOBR|nr:hypothetical protein D623_10017262 [Myotis brandtii]
MCEEMPEMQGKGRCAEQEGGLGAVLRIGGQASLLGLPNPTPPAELAGAELKEARAVSYFTEPWCMALFHDRFIDLRKELRQILTSKKEEELPSIEELARQLVDEDIDLTEKPRTYLRRVYEESIYKTLVERSILDYLHYNHYHLPMYAWPGII